MSMNPHRLRAAAVLVTVAALNGVGACAAEPLSIGENKDRVAVVGPCGNGEIDVGEVCDGQRLGDYACSTFAGYASGTLQCKADCSGFFLAQCVRGTTVTAASACFADVRAAVDRATAGDIVQIPPGSCVWTSTLTIDKPIVLRGAGQDLTTIVNGGDMSTLVEVSPAVDEPVRITALSFDNAGYAVKSDNMRSAIHVSGKVTRVRIDHCRFKEGVSQIWWAGWAYGVVDHCAFENGNVAVRCEGDQSAAWSRPIVPGTVDAVVIEDSTFTIDDNPTCAAFGTVLIGLGARVTARNSTFRSTCSNAVDAPISASGNFACDDTGSPLGCRGAVLIEIYRNTFDWNRAYRMLFVRGGSLLVFGNTMTAPSSSQPAAIVLAEEDGWGEQAWENLTQWPGYDPVNSSFFWDNTIEGRPIAASDVALSNSHDPTFIREGRDFWMHAPAESGGRTNWVGAPGTGETFTASGPNAYYPFTPLVYPHPLVTAQD